MIFLFYFIWNSLINDCDGKETGFCVFVLVRFCPRQREVSLICSEFSSGLDNEDAKKKRKKKMKVEEFDQMSWENEEKLGVSGNIRPCTEPNWWQSSC